MTTSWRKLATIPLSLCLLVLLGPRLGAETSNSLISGYLGKVAMEAIIREPSVRVEIDLTDEQHAAFRDLHNDYMRRRREISRQARGLVEQGRSTAEITRLQQLDLDKNTARLAPRVKELLKPGQYARLEQVVLQKQIRGVGVRYLQASPIVNALELTSAELAEWKLILNREHQRVSDRRESLFKEHSDAIASLLTAEQRAAFDNIHGKSFRDNGGSISEFEYDEHFKILKWGPVLDLLRFADVRKEIEMIDDQYAQVGPLLERYNDDYETLARALSPSRSDPDTQEEFRRVVLRMQQEATQRLEKEILLPHQMARLQQLIFQSRLGRYAPNPLLSPLVAEKIGLTKSQQAKILDTMRQQSAESKAKRAELSDDALKNCIDALTPAQQDRYHRLFGKPFDPER